MLKQTVAVRVRPLIQRWLWTVLLTSLVWRVLFGLGDFLTQSQSQSDPDQSESHSVTQSLTDLSRDLSSSWMANSGVNSHTRRRTDGTVTHRLTGSESELNSEVTYSVDESLNSVSVTVSSAWESLMSYRVRLRQVYCLTVSKLLVSWN